MNTLTILNDHIMRHIGGIQWEAIMFNISDDETYIAKSLGLYDTQTNRTTIEGDLLINGSKLVIIKLQEFIHRLIYDKK